MKKALDYICKKEKTEDGKYVSGINCQPQYAYEQMRQTKELFGKTDKRQAYHLIISFKEGEVDAATAFEVIGRFAREYLGKEYEAVYSVHNDTGHIHGHIIFNSVSFLTGRKYRYEKGDWARHIQPITNRLCEEYGLSTIELAGEEARTHENYKEWQDAKEGKSVWTNMIKRDLDACILLSPTFDSFTERMEEKGYEVKNSAVEGKYLSIKPPGMGQFKRCKSFGERYTEEQIRQRIVAENLSEYKQPLKDLRPRIVTCRVRRYRRARFSGLQKRYFARLYRTGKLKKKAYSQVLKYKEDIRKMKKLQEEYLFLARHDITDMVTLLAIENNLTDKRKSITAERSRLYRERNRYQPLFVTVTEMEELKECEHSYQAGDAFFLEEHEQYASLQGKIEKEGYSQEEIQSLKEYFRERIIEVREKERAVRKELSLAKLIRKELTEAGERSRQEEKTANKELVESRYQEQENQNKSGDRKYNNRDR